MLPIHKSLYFLTASTALFFPGNLTMTQAFGTPTPRSSFATARHMSSESSSYTTTEDGVYVVDAMPPPLPEKLKNTYFLLRHGQSEGNVEGVISSARSLATSSKHGLTPLGIEQGQNSAASLIQLIEQHVDTDTKTNKVYFYSSPFSRAKQTAEACLDGLTTNENLAKIQELNLDIVQKDHKEDILIEDAIMERFFGDLDAEPLATYGYVWPNDMKDPTQTGYNVESVAAVSTRLRETVMRIEGSEVHGPEGDIVVLTSHADVLQILQTYASGLENVGEFSSYRFGNGEVRFMGRTPDTLPDPQPLELPKDDSDN